MSTPEGPTGPVQDVPGPRGPYGDANPAGVADGGIEHAWNTFMYAIGRGVPDQVNASKRGRIALRQLARRRL